MFLVTALLYTKTSLVNGSPMDDLTVYKSRELLRAQQGLKSLNDMRIVSTCIAKFNASDAVEGEALDVCLPAKEYAEIFGLTMNSAYDALSAAVDRLKDRRVQFQDGTEARWFEHIAYRRGVGCLEIRWGDEIIPHIRPVLSIEALKEK